MSRIALVTGPDAGHAYPVLGVGAELVRRGHDVTVWTGPPHERLAASLGIGWALLARLAPQDADVDLGHRLWGRAADMAPPLASDLRAADIDLVVVDTLTRAGGLAAQLCDLPHVEVVPHHLADPDPALPPVGLGRPAPRTPWRRIDDRQLVRRQQRSIAAGTAQGREAARQVGLVDLSPPQARLLQTLPSLERPRPSWPTDAHVVGPLAVDPDLPRLDPPPGDAPLVVVTDTTATGSARSYGDLATAALAGLDLRVVVTTGAVPARAGHGLVVGRGPHAPLLAEAAVAVSPGGGGFVTKAAAHGVPQVVAPIHGDQREAAARLREVGAGRTLRRPRSWSLRWAVVTTLTDRRARAAASALATEAATLGPGVAADLVETVLAGDVPVARGPGVTHARPAARGHLAGPRPIVGADRG